MTSSVLAARSVGSDLARRAWSADARVWVVAALLLAAIFAFDPAEGLASAAFTARALAQTAPYLVLSIAIAAWARATGADGLIARAFTGAPAVMIVIAALAGALSPFCSCGVIPLIAALLAMGVPLSAVMAFWLASPVMDPSMFVLTAGVVGTEFAVAKTLAAVGLGLFGGFVTFAIARAGGLSDPLRPGVGDGGCGGSKVRTRRDVVWAFWREEPRRAKFRSEGVRTTLFLAKWLTLAFLLESLMVAYVPADLVASALGGAGLVPIATATLVGVPAYLNGYAALPLVSGLMEQGDGARRGPRVPGGGRGHVHPGGDRGCLPSSSGRSFALYIALAGSFAAGLLFQLWSGL